MVALKGWGDIVRDYWGIQLLESSLLSRGRGKGGFERVGFDRPVSPGFRLGIDGRQGRETHP